MSAAEMSAAENPYAGQGAVLLDIGGDIGALVVTVPARMAGAEVEIRPVDATARAGVHHFPHVAVVGRPTPNGTRHSLVYSGVAAGRYRLHLMPDRPATRDGSDGPVVQVDGGRVTEIAWPA